MRYSETPTAYAVNCSTHGRVFLTEAEYDRQMNKPNSLWVCPICTAVSDFDDEWHEDWQESKGHPQPKRFIKLFDELRERNLRTGKAVTLDMTDVQDLLATLQQEFEILVAGRVARAAQEAFDKPILDLLAPQERDIVFQMITDDLIFLSPTSQHDADLASRIFNRIEKGNTD